ncbi:MAG: tetratricopeptide repeat protein, partial [Planctomycetota bacterium]
MKMQSVVCFLLGGMIFGLTLFLNACSDPHEKAECLLEEAQQLRDKAAGSGEEEKTALLEEMERLLEQAVELDPEFLNPQLALALTRWEKGEQIEAVRMSEALCEKFPDQHKVWNLAGGFFDQIQQGERAVDAFSKALDLGGDKRELLLKLGAAAGRCGKFDEAFEAFDQALELGASRDVVYFNLGLCYEGTKQYELAMDSYLKSHEANPSYVPVLNKLVEYYREYNVPGAPDLDLALEYAKKAFESSPSD